MRNRAIIELSQSPYRCGFFIFPEVRNFTMGIMNRMRKKPRVELVSSDSDLAVLVQLPWKTFNSTMDFHHRYYKINKTFLSILALWPYQTARARLCIRIFIDPPAVPYVMAAALSTAKSHSNGESMVEHACNHAYIFMTLIKIVSSFGNLNSMLQLLNRIRHDWQVWADDQEVTFLHRYADQGRTMTIAYAGDIKLPFLRTVMIFSTGFIVLSEPVLRKINNVILKNTTEPGDFPVPVDFYFFDAQEYYYYIMMYSWITIFAGTLVQVATDSMLYVYVQHCCGIFSAIAHKLERIENNNEDVEAGDAVNELEREDTNLKNLMSCVKRHNDAIKYAELIDATYSWCFFGIVATDMFLISILGVQVITDISNLHDIIKFVVWTITAMILLYCYSYMSQIMMDHSTRIRDHIYNGKWYRLSLRHQKLLLFMLMRSSVPCKLTAGKIAVMSMENYTSLLKTCFSFFTFLNSM